MKAIVKTTGEFSLLESYTRDFVTDKPCVVTWTQFFEARTGNGQLKVLASRLPDTASDEEFQQYLNESENEDLAVAAFISQYEEPKEEKKPARRKKTASEE